MPRRSTTYLKLRGGDGGVEPPLSLLNTDLNRARLPFRHIPWREGERTRAQEWLPPRIGGVAAGVRRSTRWVLSAGAMLHADRRRTSKAEVDGERCGGDRFGRPDRLGGGAA